MRGFWYIVFGFTVIVGIGIGFAFGVYTDDAAEGNFFSQKESKQYIAPTPIFDRAALVALVKETKVLSIQTDGCISGYRRFENKYFSLCVPDELDPIADPNASVQIFEDNEYELYIEHQTNSAWRIHLCNFEKDVKIASYSGTRVSFRNENPAGCGSSTGFATMIYTDNDLPSLIYYHTKTRASFDEAQYEPIEQSFTLN